jgi:ABC-type dipeptide/oligopeptide/nickel transport system ATPase component
VSQSSISALNPALRIGTHFQEAWRAHRRDAAWRQPAEYLLESLRISPTAEFFSRFPRELSIGMAQRVVIALGMLHNPALLIADEPTSALDLATQNELLDLFRRRRADQGMAVLFVSHDLLALMAICDRIAVLRHGELVEVLPGKEFLIAARHPYTVELASSLRALLPSEIPVSAESGPETEHYLNYPQTF